VANPGFSDGRGGFFPSENLMTLFLLINDFLIINDFLFMIFSVKKPDDLFYHDGGGARLLCLPLESATDSNSTVARQQLRCVILVVLVLR